MWLISKASTWPWCCIFLVDGGWSDWSKWSPCKQIGDSMVGDQCLCRRRSCDSPTPVFGGKDCRGDQVQVANCTGRYLQQTSLCTTIDMYLPLIIYSYFSSLTVNGGWTEWSDWSGCSATCDVGMMTRKRSCTNPAPQFGGRVCVGADRDEQYCHDNPPCPGRNASIFNKFSMLIRKISVYFNPATATLVLIYVHTSVYIFCICIYSTNQDPSGRPVVPVEWVEPVYQEMWWRSWGEEQSMHQPSTPIQRQSLYRQRPFLAVLQWLPVWWWVNQCNLTLTSCDKLTLFGSNVTLYPAEVRKTSTWTHWVRTNNTKEGYIEERFRMVCKAKVEDVDNIRFNVKNQVRFCSEGGQDCLEPGEELSVIASQTDKYLHKVCKEHRKRRKYDENLIVPKPKRRVLGNRIPVLNDHGRRRGTMMSSEVFKGFCGCRDLGNIRICKRCAGSLKYKPWRAITVSQWKDISNLWSCLVSNLL